MTRVLSGMLPAVPIACPSVSSGPFEAHCVARDRYFPVDARRLAFARTVAQRPFVPGVPAFACRSIAQPLVA
jgi:hypothetical protein